MQALRFLAIYDGAAARLELSWMRRIAAAAVWCASKGMQA